MSTRTDPQVLLRPTLQRLAEFAALAPNWDSYGAAAPSSVAISAARRLIEALAERAGAIAGERVRPYAVAPLADGGVQIEWRGTCDALEVEIGPDGTVDYLLVAQRGADRTFHEAENVSLPAALDLVARVVTTDVHE